MWEELSQGQKEGLALKWGLNMVGEPPELTNESELEKVPAHVWETLERSKKVVEELDELKLLKKKKPVVSPRAKKKVKKVVKKVIKKTKKK